MLFARAYSWFRLCIRLRLEDCRLENSRVDDAWRAPRRMRNRITAPGGGRSCARDKFDQSFRLSARVQTWIWRGLRKREGRIGPIRKTPQGRRILRAGLAGRTRL